MIVHKVVRIRHLLIDAQAPLLILFEGSVRLLSRL